MNMSPASAVAERFTCASSSPGYSAKARAARSPNRRAQGRAIVRRRRCLLVQDRRVEALLRVRSQQQRHMCLRTAGQRGGRRLGEEITIHIRAEIAVPDAARRHGRLEQRLPPASRAMHRATRRLPLHEGLRPVPAPRPAAAARSARSARRSRRWRRRSGCLLKRRGHMGADRDRAGRFAADGHAARIAAETGDVVAHPAQGRGLVQQAVVARRMLRRFGRQPGVARKPNTPRR